MFQNMQVLDASIALAKNAGRRQAASAQNLANADTPGYKALRVSTFQASFDSASGQQIKTTRSQHTGSAAPFAFQDQIINRTSADPNGNAVNLEEEMMEAAQAKSDHTKALSIIQSSLKILRLSLGKS
ncbi:MAG: flagellar basal body protein [Pseudomonadota bacterium]|nr:flagellar biosynthesis protein FlgB [Thalassococcus sp.]MEC7667927.1 flagellar basal body protein [Pseudomonadota bacterium]